MSECIACKYSGIDEREYAAHGYPPCTCDEGSDISDTCAAKHEKLSDFQHEGEGMSEIKPILDACCGSRMFWFNKQNPLVVFGDIRTEDHILCDGRKLVIKPDVLMDFRKMPFSDKSFKLVVFDPPHLRGAGKKGWQAKKYGSLSENWRDDIKQGFDECMRVLDDWGLLIFKWNEQTIKVNEVIRAIGREPLIGHRTLQTSKTIWMTFIKERP